MYADIANFNLNIFKVAKLHAKLVKIDRERERVRGWLSEKVQIFFRKTNIFCWLSCKKKTNCLNCEIWSYRKSTSIVPLWSFTISTQNVYLLLNIALKIPKLQKMVQSNSEVFFTIHLLMRLFLFWYFCYVTKCVCHLFWFQGECRIR